MRGGFTGVSCLGWSGKTRPVKDKLVHDSLIVIKQKRLVQHSDVGSVGPLNFRLRVRDTWQTGNMFSQDYFITVYKTFYMYHGE